MDHEQSPFTQRDEDELSSPADGLDAHAGDGVDEGLRFRMPDDGREAQLTVDDRATDKVRPQVRNDGLDLRKLWHLVHLPQPPHPVGTSPPRQRRGVGRYIVLKLAPQQAFSYRPSSVRPSSPPR